MLDTKGPEIRTGLLVDHAPIELVSGQDLEITTDYSIEGDATRISCSYRALPETVQVGSIIYIADGSLTCEVTEILEVSTRARILLPANKIIIDFAGLSSFRFSATTVPQT